MRTCTMCRIPKGESQFRKRRANCRDCDTARHKEWRSRNREHMREYDRKRWKSTDRWDDHIRRKYGLSPEGYAELLRKQDGKCAICKTSKPGGNRCARFHVDHIHGTKTIRGLLCSRCNRMIGTAEDNPKLLETAISYLVAPQAQAFIEAYLEVVIAHAISVR